MSLRLQLVVAALLAALLAAGWWWLVGQGASEGNGEPGAKPAVATLVLVEAVVLARDRVTVRAVGTGKAIRSASIHPAVAGEVIEVAFKAEQRVRKGQPLLRLDAKHQRLAYKLAEVAVGEAQRQLDRLQRLATSGAASRARLETAGAALESARLRLGQAKADLDDRTVYAAFAGVVGLTDLDEGDRVTVDSRITTLDDRSSILVEFYVPEDHAGKVQVGDPVSMKPWSNPERELTGLLIAVASRIDEATRSLKVQAEIANPGDTIRPGSSLEARLDFIGRAFPRVREVAVSWSRDGAYLWRVGDGKAEKVSVKLVRRDRGRLLVDGPLVAGDLIVVEGVQGLRPGRAVRAEAFVARTTAAPARPEKADDS